VGCFGGCWGCCFGSCCVCVRDRLERWIDVDIKRDIGNWILLKVMLGDISNVEVETLVNLD
jgi:hypothetical protein